MRASTLDAPSAGRLDLERAGGVDGRADHAIAGLLLDRDRFAGQHRLVDGAAAGPDDAVHRNALAGPHDDEVAGCAPRRSATSTSWPSRRTRAVDGCSLASWRKARVVLRFARASMALPSSTSAMMMITAS